MEERYVSKHYELPVPGTATGDVLFRSQGQTCKLTFPCHPDEGDPFDLTITFCEVQAFRHTNDIFYTLDHLEAYDTVVEVHNSGWLQEVMEPEVVQRYHLSNYRHYMFFLDSNGCFEFLAKRFTVRQAEHVPQEDIRANQQGASALWRHPRPDASSRTAT